MQGHDIIVIGASAGGIDALRELVSAFPPDLPAAVFVVQHTSPAHESYLPEILSRAGPLPAAHPADHEEIQKGRIYVAPPDHHLMILNGHVGAVRGPKESRHRPSADTLFRSAADLYGSRVVGVVLTGALYDGTVGLQAIKEKGGVAVVQDPGEAYSPGMPTSAMRYVKVDYCLPLRGIAPMLDQLARDPVVVAERPKSKETCFVASKDELKNYTPSGLTCPECHAGLFETRHGGLIEFRCRVGHTFSPDGLLADLSEALERALWASLNLIEERAALINLLTGQSQERDENSLAWLLKEKAEGSSHHADQIRQMLVGDGNWYSIADL